MNFITNEIELDKIANVLGEIERIRLLDKSGHADFVNEIRWNNSEAEKTLDGIDLKTIDLSNSETVGLEIAKEPEIIELLKDWNLGGAFKKLTIKSIDSAGAIGIITTKELNNKTHLNGGRAVQKAWLEANLNGISFQPIASSVFLFHRLIVGNGIGFEKETINKLNDLRKDYLNALKIDELNHEIFIFRLCIAENLKTRSLRKPLNELLLIE